jgi:cytochrome c biogenesis protein CcdA
VTFGAGTYGLSALAGVLTTLSPCVLPLVPVLMGSAISTHRLGPLALAAGVAGSFTLSGVLLAAAGSSLGLDAESLHAAGGVLFVALGVVLVSSRLQAQFARLTAGVSGAGGTLASRLSIAGVAGQLVLGLLLGVVWSPCVGPTLGAAVTLASQGHDLTQIALVMVIFGVSASVPMLAVGLLSRAALARRRAGLRTLGARGKQVLGAALIALGLLTLSHGDRVFESWLLDHSPGWLTALTTRY